MSKHERPILGGFRSSYRSVSGIVAELRERNRLLFAVAAGNLALAAVFTALIGLDGRTLLGRNVWTKPWKFATSIAIFAATLAWLLPSLSLGRRLQRRVSYVVAATMTAEITLITTQAARGVPSHFNRSTPLDTVIFVAMGVAITVSTLAVTYVLWRVVRSPPELPAAYLRGIQLGLLVFVLASFEGGLMAAHGSHAVGAPADGAGLPLLNWSTAGGDLRVAHFVGLHSLQVLPLVGYLAARSGRLSDRESLLAVLGVSGLYGGVTGAAFLQALLGQPLIASLPVPSLSTVFAGSFLLVAPFWALMILRPGWDVTERVVASPLVVAPAAALYLLLLVPQVGAVAGGVLSPTLSGMVELLGSDAGATLAWVHFLAFDLFVGRWIYLDARRRDPGRLVLAPLLAGTLLFGPVGFLGYAVVRRGWIDGASAQA